MSNEQRFYESCKIMANLEDMIKTFEKLGFIIEPDKDNIGSKIYEACSSACSVATSLLNFPTVNEENDVYNILLSATSENVEEVSRKVWEEYGVK